MTDFVFYANTTLAIVCVDSDNGPRHSLVTEVADGLWPVTADPTRLHQVLLNLAVNARDAMPAGGTLSISVTNISLDAQYAGTSSEAKAGSHVLIKVTDTGVGIPLEIRERIFEPFFTTKETGHGTGLGLATVYTIVKSQGGYVTVDSEMGRGTTFKIYLPASPSLRTDASAPPFQADPPRGRGEFVLVIDDEFAIRHITQQTLEAFGYRVITAGDGAEGIALYVKHAQQIALVITDMMMPVMDGAATIQVLKHINPSVKIIAASGIGSGEHSPPPPRVAWMIFWPSPTPPKPWSGWSRKSWPGPPRAPPPEPACVPPSVPRRKLLSFLCEIRPSGRQQEQPKESAQPRCHRKPGRHSRNRRRQTTV